MTDERYQVVNHDGDQSVVDQYTVGKNGVIRKTVLVKGDTFRVIVVIDRHLAMQ